ncbi:ribosomal RNA adenine dimethylase family protein [Striga asiatica]|uniref:Ribosomal RNA adenine dimethylase family protein n=1 Tax=Striga asiatica TaxID=4170 RepID=A0A5A7REH3_STRAF|nr:ribosomal RNA adenine dimethylase family protein [Striga asiatica]
MGSINTIDMVIQIGAEVAGRRRRPSMKSAHRERESGMDSCSIRSRRAQYCQTMVGAWEKPRPDGNRGSMLPEVKARRRSQPRRRGVSALCDAVESLGLSDDSRACERSPVGALNAGRLSPATCARSRWKRFTGAAPTKGSTGSCG